MATSSKTNNIFSFIINNIRSILLIFSQKVLLYMSNGLQTDWEDSMSETYKTEKELLKNSQKTII